MIFIPHHTDTPPIERQFGILFNIIFTAPVLVALGFVVKEVAKFMNEITLKQQNLSKSNNYDTHLKLGH